MDWLPIIERLGGLPFATFLIMVGVAGYLKKWVWGWQLAECEERCKALCQAAETREREWKELALAGGRIAEEAVDIVKRRR